MVFAPVDEARPEEPSRIEALIAELRMRDPTPNCWSITTTSNPGVSEWSARRMRAADAVSGVSVHTKLQTQPKIKNRRPRKLARGIFQSSIRNIQNTLILSLTSNILRTRFFSHVRDFLLK